MLDPELTMLVLDNDSRSAGLSLGSVLCCMQLGKWNGWASQWLLWWQPHKLQQMQERNW